MTEENKSGENEGNDHYLGNWQTKEAAEEGLQNMQSKMDLQGNELGALRKQVELSQQLLDEARNQPLPEPSAPATNYDQELKAVQAEMANLDPADESYQADMVTLINKSNTISRQFQHEETLAKASEAFKQELNDRDIRSTHDAFYKENPDFNTPEMQMRIKEYIAKDTSGMSDSLVAYREIQRDNAVIAAKALEDENAELKRLVELAKGTDSTGKVITQGQPPPQAKQPKTTGVDRDKGMQEALNALRA